MERGTEEDWRSLDGKKTEKGVVGGGGGRMDKDGRKIRERQKNVRGGGLCKEK